MRFEVLGPVRGFRGVRELSLGGRQQRLVLALLISADGRAVSTGQLIDGVWGDQPPDTAKKALQGYVHHLRSQVGDVLVTERNGYSIRLDDRVDAIVFERRQREASGLIDVDPRRAGDLLQEALAMWKGPAYADLTDELALAPERTRLDDLRIVALGDLVDVELTMGRHAALIGQLEGLTREYPLHERFRAQHVTALYRAGRQVEALRSFEQLRRYLLEEMALEPSAELQRLEQQILSQDPDLLGPADSADTTPMTVRGYELRELVASGPTGRTYRAYQRSVGREMAVKVLSREVADDAGFIANFIVDSKAVAALEHPHICYVVDTWREPGRAYRVSRWLAGGSLDDAIRSGELGANSAMRVLEQVGSALAHAHRHGVVHGQVSPAHVMFDEADYAYLTEFSIGESRGVDPAQDRLDFAVLAHAALTGRTPQLVDGARVPDVDDGETAARARNVFEVAFSPDGYRRIEDFLRALRQALGIDTVALPDRDGSPRREARNPYKGLQAFQESDAADFFGRDDLIDTVIEQLARHQLVAVIGPSGSGKSSLIRAGVTKRLRTRDGAAPLLISEMYPGAYPFEELEDALLRVGVNRDSVIGDLLGDERGLRRVLKQVLPSDDAELVLVIDQFEELFSMVTDEEVRRLFLASLVAATAGPRPRVRVIVTMRADFFDRPLEYPEFGAALEAGLVPVTVPDDGQLASAIVEPARSVGVEYEPGLISHIVHEVSGQPGGLPLLQYALTELFEGRDSNTLTLAAYQRSGSVFGALGRRAEQLFVELRPDAQRAARHAFLRMVAVDETAGDLRRRVRRADLTGVDVDDQSLNEALHSFGAHRLLTFDLDPVTRGPTVEVAHEALLREWSRLGRWVDEQREDLIIRKRLEAAMAEWRNADEDPSFLPTGNRLAQFTMWADDAPLSISEDEHAFLQAGLEREALGRRRAARHRRGLFGGLVIVAVVLAAAAVFSNAQRRDADAAAAAAEDRRLAAAASSVSPSDMSLGLLLAVEAYRRDAGPAAQGALLTALTAHGPHLGFGPTDRDRNYAGIVTTELGDLLVLDDRWISLIDPATRGEIRRWSTDTRPIDPQRFDTSRFSLGGTTAMFVDAQHRIRVLDVGDPSAEVELLDVDVGGDVDAGWLSPTGRHGLFLARPRDEAVEMTLVDVDAGRTTGSIDLVRVLDAHPSPYDLGDPDDHDPSVVFIDDDTVAIAAGWFLGTFDVGDGTMLDATILDAGERQDRVYGTVLDVVPGGGFLVAGPDVVAWYDTDLELLGVVEFARAESVLRDSAIVGAIAQSSERAAVLFGNGAMWEVERASGTRSWLASSEVGGWAITDVAEEALFVVVGKAGMAYISSDGRGPLTTAVPRAPGETKLAVGSAGSFVVSRAVYGVTPGAVSGSSSSLHVCVRAGCEPGTDLGTNHLDVDNGSPDVISIVQNPLNINATIHVVDPVSGDRLSAPIPNVWEYRPEVVVTTDEWVAFPERQGMAVKDRETGVELGWLPLPDDFAEIGGAYDPNTGRLLVMEGPVPFLFNTRSWEEEALPLPLSIVAAAWNSGGSLLATVEERGQIAIRDGLSWRPIRVVANSRPSSTPFADQPLAFTSDDRYLLGVTNGAAQLWDVETGQQIGPSLETEPGTTPAVAPGEVLSLVTAGDRSTLLWNLDVSTWADIACQLAGRNMTAAEWNQFGPQDELHRPTCPEWVS